MPKPKILIVGCGAVGLSQGYHLSEAAEITYLVRPGRRPAFVAPKKLYDYKDNVLHIFSDYHVIESTSEVAETSFLFVLDTLDGHTARSEGGTATLRAVGDIIRDTPTFVVYDAVGVGIEDYYASKMGISKNRLLLAASMLAHQPTPRISFPATADRNLVAQADILYTGFFGKYGLITSNSKPQLAKMLQETYAQNGKLKVNIMPTIVEWTPYIALVHFMTWNLDKNQPFAHLRANGDLWNLMLRAQSEVLALPRFGWKGWVLSWVLTSWVTAKFFQMQIDGFSPVLYHEFNAFHHGEKVVKQDIAMLVDLVQEGDRAGRKMVALRELIRRAKEM